jgi:hypothetical protein
MSESTCTHRAHRLVDRAACGLAGLLFFGLTLPTHDPELVVLPIDAVVMDQAVLQAAGQKHDDQERREEERQKRAAAEAEEKRLEDERLQQEKTEEQAKEQARVEAEQKAKADAGETEG